MMLHAWSLTRDVLFCKPDGHDVGAWLSRTIWDATSAILHVLCLYVHLTGTLDGQRQTTITYEDINAIQTKDQTHHAININRKHLNAWEINIVLILRLMTSLIVCDIFRTNCINIWSSLCKWEIISHCGTNYQFFLSFSFPALSRFAQPVWIIFSAIKWIWELEKTSLTARCLEDLLYLVFM